MKSLQDNCPTSFPFRVGHCLGAGVHGQVFDSLDEPGNAIKLSIVYSDDEDAIVKFNNLERVYKFIIDNPNDILVKVFKFGRIYNGARDIFGWEQEYIIYYSIMEKLLPISDDERKTFKTICDSFNGILKTNRSIKELINELNGWLEFDKDKVFDFYKSLHSLKIEHRDIEARNIMKNYDGQFKLIDFDLARIKENNNDNTDK